MNVRLDQLAEVAFKRYGKVLLAIGLIVAVECGNSMWPTADQNGRLYYVCDRRRCGRHSRDQVGVDEAAWTAFRLSCDRSRLRRVTTPEERRSVMRRLCAHFNVNTNPAAEPIARCDLCLELLA